jgi:hypothetical protein
MRAIILFALGSSLAIVGACSSSSNEASSCFCDVVGEEGLADSGEPHPFDAGPDGPSITSIDPANDLCLPSALPVDGGVADCRFITFFADAGSCALPGFSVATAADESLLESVIAANQEPITNGAFCIYAQLPEDACAEDAGVGWCYAPGGCAGESEGVCAQALCTSNGDSLDGGTYTWLICP